MNKEDINFQYTQIDDSINIRAEIEKYLSYWKWFLLSVAIALFFSFLYLRYTAPTYNANATILIKDNKNAGISAELEAFKDLGIIGNGSANNPDNEIEILKSRKIIGNVVDSLNLDIFYYVEGRIIQTEVYQSSSPIKFNFIKKDSLLIHKDTLVSIEILDNKNFKLTSESGLNEATYLFGNQISTKLGDFSINLNKSISKEEKTVKLHLRPKFKVIDNYRKKINITTADKNSSVLKLSLSDVVREKSEYILNEIVRQYNIDAIKDKNQVSKKTKEFIDGRLENIGKELAIIDNDVEKFKSSKGFTGIPEEISLILKSLSENNQEIVLLQTQLSLAEWIQKQLNSDSKKNEVLPTSLGFEDTSISQSIVKYNELVLDKKQLDVTAGEKNPFLIQLDAQIQSFKSSLLNSIENTRKSLEIQLKQLKKEELKITNQVSLLPIKERGFIDIARQQEIISELYQYLLKKKEETDISLAVAVPNAKIIDVAYSSKIPVSPKKKLVLLAALALGLFIPFAIIYLKDLLDTKVHNKQDIEAELSIPYLGDIPNSESKERIITSDDARSSAAEAFRLIRTNLDFMLANSTQNNRTIFITSTTSGEGKSFVSINLASTLAIPGKKVLLIGMDLRAPKVTEYLGISERIGVTNYITDADLTIEDITFSIPELKGLDIISSGIIPPNPSELLMTKRVEELFEISKQNYDIIVVDTAPINLVTDTLLIAKHADMVVYTVRANYLDKRLLSIPKTLYKEKRLPNMAILLNDTDPKKTYGYGYGYGGYGYGHSLDKKPWYKKIFNF